MTEGYSELSRTSKMELYMKIVKNRKPLTIFTKILAYSSSYNLKPAISTVLIGQYLIFCLPTWPECCSSLRKCTLVKYNMRQIARPPIVTWATFYFQIIDLFLNILLLYWRNKEIKASRPHRIIKGLRNILA